MFVVSDFGAIKILKAALKFFHAVYVKASLYFRACGGKQITGGATVPWSDMFM